MGGEAEDGGRRIGEEEEEAGEEEEEWARRRWRRRRRGGGRGHRDETLGYVLLVRNLLYVYRDLAARLSGTFGKQF
eukprot:9064771-Pyramimonas_sp.AAC.1